MRVNPLTSRSTAFDPMGGARCPTFVWGSSRPAVNRVLFAIATEIDPEFAWLDIRLPNDEPEEPGPVELGWIPDHRLFFTRRMADLTPPQTVKPEAIVRVVRSDDPNQDVGAFADFLRLPSLTQKIVADLGPAPRGRVLVVSNSERVREHYPSSPEAVRPLIDAHLAAGLIPMFGLSGPSGPGRMAMDMVCEVRVADLGHWREGWLICEKSPPWTSFHAGDKIPLSSVGSIAAAFLRPTSGTSDRRRGR